MNVRTKGHQFERDMVIKLKPIFPDVSTSRSQNRSLDDRGVDLVNTGNFRIQCKAVEKLGNIHTIIDYMDSKMLDDEYGMNIVFHKRNRQGIIVSMRYEDFIDLIKNN